MIVALSNGSTITISIAGAIVFLAILAALRVLIRREPPASWRRFRMGVFVERDPAERDDDP